MLKLYAFDRSPFGWKVRVALAEKKIQYEMIVPENKNEDPAFARLNPFRKTPVLALEDGRTIYESTVINEYLEETQPQPAMRSEEHTSELQSLAYLVCRLLLEKKKKKKVIIIIRTKRNRSRIVIVITGLRFKKRHSSAYMHYTVNCSRINVL